AEARIGYKTWVCVALGALTLIVFTVLFLCGKRNIKNYIFVLAAAVLLICAVLLSDIKSADDYYSGSDGDTSGTVIGTVMMTIRCDTVVGKSDSEYVPADGTVLPVTEFGITEGESVYDVLVRAAKRFGIQFENDGGAYGLAYISGINYLYEFDFGELSGWRYTVNGTIPSVGCAEYTLSNGDVIEWHYTCDLGNDLG
ncbi:MAG TPA: DUF4430 domain-containing protein, partial [Bacillota bacterium]|nr:DUF4430 domain-containing protein [Bacillota bacterium]